MIAAVPREKLSCNDTRFSSIKKIPNNGRIERVMLCVSSVVFIPLERVLGAFLFWCTGYFRFEKKTVLFAFSGKQRGKIKERRNEPVWE